MHMLKFLQNKGSAYRGFAVLLLLVAISFILYGNTISNQFVFDDIPLIVENSAIKSLKNIPEIIGFKNGTPLYRPVRFLSYLIDYSFSGLNPKSYHISNILYHAATAFVLFCLLKLLTGSAAVAVTGALLFTVHPVHTDSVAYISGRRDILCTLFYLSGFYCFILFRQKEKKLYMVLTSILFAAALGSKEMAVTLPAVCLLYDFICVYGRFSGKVFRKELLTRLKPYVVLSLMGALYLYYKIILHYPSLRTQYYGGSAESNFSTVFRILWRYIKLTLFPVVLHADYSYNAFSVSSTFFEPGVIGSASVVILLIFSGILSLRREKLVFFGIIWFFVTLLPVCHIFPHHEILAEHYLYLPSVGFIIALSPLWKHVFSWDKPEAQRHKGTEAQRHRGTEVQRYKGTEEAQRHRCTKGQGDRGTGAKWNKAFIAVIISILFLFSVRTIVRNRDWKDGMTLWASVLETTPECARAHDNLGSEFFRIKDFKKALYHYRQAVNIRPGHGIFHNNLGMALGATGDIDQAEAEFKKAIALNSGLAAAYNNLGIVYYKKKKYTKAAWFFWKSARMKPGAKAWFNCGKAQLKRGAIFKAAFSFQRAIRYNNTYAEAYKSLGTALKKVKQYKKAIKVLQRATVLKPGDAETYYITASVYEKMGDRKKALWYLERAMQAAGDPVLKSRIEKELKKGVEDSRVRGVK